MKAINMLNLLQCTVKTSRQRSYNQRDVNDLVLTSKVYECLSSKRLSSTEIIFRMRGGRDVSVLDKTLKGKLHI